MLAKIGFDTAENEPFKIIFSCLIIPRIRSTNVISKGPSLQAGRPSAPPSHRWTCAAPRSIRRCAARARRCPAVSTAAASSSPRHQSRKHHPSVSLQLKSDIRRPFCAGAVFLAQIFSLRRYGIRMIDDRGKKSPTYGIIM